MQDYTATHSVAQKPLDRQTTSAPYNIVDVGRVGIAAIMDKRLRTSPLAIAVLAGLIVHGGAGEGYIEPPTGDIAAALGTGYDGMYKAYGRLAEWGYLDVVRSRKGHRRLAVRVVWPLGIESIKPRKPRTPRRRG